MTRHPAPRYRTSAKRHASRRARPVNPFVLMVAFVTVAALGWGVWALGAPSQGREKPASGRASAEVSQAAQDGAATPIKHVTFGAHTRANQPCASCHTDQPDTEIACRNCHGNVCGKGAKTASDCVECHKNGTTDDWTSGTQ